MINDNQSKGWVKIHRQLLEWEWYSDINTTRLYLHLLLRSNHMDKKWRGVVIKKGSLITGRKILSAETGLSEQQIRSSLKKLKSTNEITIKTTNLNSLISIVKWNKYQSEQPTNQPTNNQQITTNKNVKNVKNIKEIKKEKTLINFRAFKTDFINDSSERERIAMQQSVQKVQINFAAKLFIDNCEKSKYCFYDFKHLRNSFKKWVVYNIPELDRARAWEVNKDFKF